MVKRIDEIQDDEIRVIGHPSQDEGKWGVRNWLLYVCVPLIVILVIVAVIFLSRDRGGELVAEVFDPSVETVSPEIPQERPQWLGDYTDTDGKAYVEHLRDTVNDIPLDIYIPHNAHAVLSIGTPDFRDKNIVFAAQAADIRADNGKINGAFVLAGTPMAWGLSKKGYVAIIDDKITVGVADNSPLFEEATERNGYFFRQYALVNNGVLVDNVPKNKAVRKAICDRGGEILVIMSQTRESFHDFAQALVDMDVDNAVYLVGADSYGFFRDKFDHFTQIYEKLGGGYKYENYIEWRATR